MTIAELFTHSLKLDPNAPLYVSVAFISEEGGEMTPLMNITNIGKAHDGRLYLVADGINEPQSPTVEF